MSTPTDLFVEPVLELIEDASLAFKWANGALIFRLLSQFVTAFTFGLVSGKDEKTGEKFMNVAPETIEYWAILAILNAVGLPLDIAYASFLNLAKDGNTQAFAQDWRVQIVAVGALAVTAVGSLLGVVFNIVWQLVLWIQDISTLDFTTLDMWAVLELTAKNLFDNVFYEGFKPALLFAPVYGMFAVALPYAIYMYDVAL